MTDAESPKKESSLLEKVRNVGLTIGILYGGCTAVDVLDHPTQNPQYTRPGVTAPSTGHYAGVAAVALGVAGAASTASYAGRGIRKREYKEGEDTKGWLENYLLAYPDDGTRFSPMLHVYRILPNQRLVQTKFKGEGIEVKEPGLRVMLGLDTLLSSGYVVKLKGNQRKVKIETATTTDGFELSNIELVVRFDIDENEGKIYRAIFQNQTEEGTPKTPAYITTTIEQSRAIGRAFIQSVPFGYLKNQDTVNGVVDPTRLELLPLFENPLIRAPFDEIGGTVKSLRIVSFDSPPEVTEEAKRLRAAQVDASAIRLISEAEKDSAINRQAASNSLGDAHPAGRTSLETFGWQQTARHISEQLKNGLCEIAKKVKE